MFKQVGFSFNANDCIGCHACAIACKNHNKTPSHVSWRKVSNPTTEYYISTSCYHCDSPECFRVCPEGAFSKRRDGIVLIDESRCNGCELCVNACPYKAPQYDYETNKVSKCEMCYKRQDIGLLPACVEACTTTALKLINLSSYRNSKTVSIIPGFPDINLTDPSVVFYPVKPKTRFFLE